MARTLTPERQNLRIWALQLAGLQLTQANIGRRLNVPQRTISAWLDNQAIPAKTCFFLLRMEHLAIIRGSLAGIFLVYIHPTQSLSSSAPKLNTSLCLTIMWI